MIVGIRYANDSNRMEWILDIGGRKFQWVLVENFDGKSSEPLHGNPDDPRRSLDLRCVNHLGKKMNLLNRL
jgi:hypothetical protein